MRTSEDSRREQSSRFFTMSKIAREEGKPELADLLFEVALRSVVVETPSPPTQPAETDSAQQQQAQPADEQVAG